MAAVTQAELTRLGRAVVARTWQHGLPTWSWGEAVCLVGMVRFARALGARPQRRVAWLDEHWRAGITIEHVNDVAPGIAAVLAIAATPSELQSWRCRTRRRPAHWPGAATTAPNGAIEHWPGGVWADTVFMAGVFLGHLGVATGRPRPARRAAAASSSPTPRCCRTPSRAVRPRLAPRGDDPVLLGPSERVVRPGRRRVPRARGGVRDRRQRRLVEEVATSLGRQLRRTRRPPARPRRVERARRRPARRCAGIVETSAAAGIGAAMLRAGRRSSPTCRRRSPRAGWLAVRGALAYVDADGTLTRTSAGTVLQLIPFGYSVIRDDRLQLWGQGLALHAVAAALEALRAGEEPM